ncbi:MAG: PLP-dependent aminotransferase family protein [Ruminococcaceae bacterium]|nr:PLP-dependent aminotransferase family protein [Oscillospiraceae bacterium]
MEYTFSDKISSLKPSLIREILKSAGNVIPFSAGNPSVEAFPVKEMADISAYLYSECAGPALQYGITEGYTPLRDKVKARLKTKFGIGKDMDETIIVSGGQQGIELTCKVLCNEGDTVLCEVPSFIGALNAFRSYNVNLKGVPLDDDGINLEALEKAIKENKNVRFLYVIPTFQNPTGITTSAEKRKAVYEICKKYGVFILEDNPYGELRFAGKDVLPIKALDEDGIVIYCGSFSKVFSPGLRVGFVCAPQAIVQKIVVAKQVSDVHTNVFFQMLIDRYIDTCDLDAHIARISNLYKGKCELMLSEMDKHFKGVKYTRPEGGLFLWCTLPDGCDSLDFAAKAKEAGVAVVPGIAFSVENEVCPSMRFNYSMPTEQQIVEGVKILGEVIEKYI